MSQNHDRPNHQPALIEVFRYNCCWCPHREADVDTFAAAERMNGHYETAHALRLAAATSGPST